jgi:hypothetical protein
VSDVRATLTTPGQYNTTQMKRRLKIDGKKLETDGKKALPELPFKSFSVFNLENEHGNEHRETKETKKNTGKENTGENTGERAGDVTGESTGESAGESTGNVITDIITDATDTKATRCGSIEKFDAYLKAYQQTKSDFTVISYGTTKKIIYGEHKFLFSGLKGQKKPKGMHLVGLVRKDVDAYLKKNKPLSIPEKKPYLTFIHHRHLEFYGAGQEAVAIDINHCHWRTAYLIGFITETTYLKGLENTEYKEGRLIAIGTLGKILTIKKYAGGYKVSEDVDDREYLRYGGFFWAVISKVNELMVDLWLSLQEDFLMFLTDCVVIDPARKQDAIAIMEKHGYSAKDYTLVFTDISDSTVAWVKSDGEKKQIIHNRLLGDEAKER